MNEKESEAMRILIKKIIRSAELEVYIYTINSSGYAAGGIMKKFEDDIATMETQRHNKVSTISYIPLSHIDKIQTNKKKGKIERKVK